MRYNPPFGSTDSNAPYVDRNTPGAVAGSKVPAKAIEDTQREIVNVITAAGLTPSPTDLTQLAQIILSAATETERGRVELATIAETRAGTDGQRAVTPAGLKAASASIRSARSVTFGGAGTTTNWVVPADVTFIDAELWGAGGGGGGASSTGASAAGSGAGAGAYARSTRIAVTPGQVIPVTVGAAGGGGAPGQSGAAGGTSSVGSFVSASGGLNGGGGSGGIQQNAAPGGTATGGTEINLPGQGGGIGYVTSSGVAGGSGGGSFASGSTQINILSGGNIGAFPGGGGSGGAVTNGGVGGGNGGHGLVIIRY